MTRPFKVLLLVEALICFGPAAVFLPIGIMMVPLQISALIREPSHWQGPLWLIGLVVCGVAGMTALFVVLLKLWDNSTIKRPLPVLVATAMGVVGLVSYTGGVPDSAAWAIVLALPLLATAHILFLARNLLLHSCFGSGNDA